jgi:hypothetical protein
LCGPDYQEVQRRYAEEFFLPTDDAHLKARLIAGLSSLPQHVTLSAWEQHLLVGDGEEAAAACRVPALLISSGTPLSDISRFQELTPQLVTGQTVGAGHFITLFVPEQVNAMIGVSSSYRSPSPTRRGNAPAGSQPGGPFRRVVPQTGPPY